MPRAATERASGTGTRPSAAAFGTGFALRDNGSTLDAARPATPMVAMRPAAIVCFLLLVISPPALARSISMNPRPTALLRSGQFIAQDGFNSVTLYDPSGKPLARFDGGTYVWAMDVSPDERCVAVACTGPLLLGDLRTGATVWSKAPAQIGVRYARSVAFAADGRSLVVCDDADQAVVLETASGRPIGSIKVADSNFVSAALSPDGSTGALVELGGHVFTFDVATGTPRDTGQTGAWPLRFTADGKYIALRSGNSGQGEMLRVLTAADPSQSRDLGHFGHIGRIHPLPDGTLLVTATVGNAYYEGRAKTVGVRCDPAAGTITPLWEAGPRPAEFETAFDPETLLGVSTDYRLVTSLIDLRTDAVRLTIDHSAEFDRRMRETDPVRDWGRTTGEVAATIAAILLLALIVRRLRKPPPG
jgi:hypothetical protein